MICVSKPWRNLNVILTLSRATFFVMKSYGSQEVESTCASDIFTKIGNSKMFKFYQNWIFHRCVVFIPTFCPQRGILLKIVYFRDFPPKGAVLPKMEYFRKIQSNRGSLAQNRVFSPKKGHFHQKLGISEMFTENKVFSKFSLINEQLHPKWSIFEVSPKRGAFLGSWPKKRH